MVTLPFQLLHLHVRFTKRNLSHKNFLRKDPRPDTSPLNDLQNKKSQNPDQGMHLQLQFHMQIDSSLSKTLKHLHSRFTIYILETASACKISAFTIDHLHSSELGYKI